MTGDADMTDEWNFYFCELDGEPASISLDLGVGRVAPIPDFDTVAYFRVWMNSPRPDGLASREEYDTLMAIEDALKEEAGPIGALYVGRNTSGGCRDFFFYFRDEDAFRAGVSAVMSRFGEYRTEIEVWPDEKWSLYFGFLCPDDDQKQTMSNRDVILLLRKNGDDGQTPRTIDHLIIVGDRGEADAVARTVSDHGFKLKPASPSKQNDGRWKVEFDKIEAPVEIDETTIRLARLARKHGGEYDGWGCEHVRD
jgi:regulator of RNase E activity RraB